MEILLYVLSVPLGVVLLVVMCFLAMILAAKPAESIAVVVLILVSYAIGAWALGLDPAFWEG